MIIFRQGESYLWLFPIFMVAFVAAAVVGPMVTGSHAVPIVLMPIFFAYMIACQVHSGIALDSWWRAAHSKGTWEYRALLIWEGFGTLFGIVLAYFALTI